MHALRVREGRGWGGPEYCNLFHLPTSVIILHFLILFSLYVYIKRLKRSTTHSARRTHTEVHYYLSNFVEAIHTACTSLFTVKLSEMENRTLPPPCPIKVNVFFLEIGLLGDRRGFCWKIKDFFKYHPFKEITGTNWLCHVGVRGKNCFFMFEGGRDRVRENISNNAKRTFKHRGRQPYYIGVSPVPYVST